MDKDTKDRGSRNPEQFPDFDKLQRVQDVLDRNKRILNHVKVNHDSRRPEALAKNFALLREINENIEMVQSIYVQIEEDYIAFMKSYDSNKPLKHDSDDADQQSA